MLTQRIGSRATLQASRGAVLVGVSRIPLSRTSPKLSTAATTLSGRQQRAALIATRPTNVPTLEVTKDPHHQVKISVEEMRKFVQAKVSFEDLGNIPDVTMDALASLAASYQRQFWAKHLQLRNQRNLLMVQDLLGQQLVENQKYSVRLSNYTWLHYSNALSPEQVQQDMAAMTGPSGDWGFLARIRGQRDPIYAQEMQLSIGQQALELIAATACPETSPQLFVEPSPGLVAAEQAVQRALPLLQHKQYDEIARLYGLVDRSASCVEHEAIRQAGLVENQVRAAYAKLLQERARAQAMCGLLWVMDNCPAAAPAVWPSILQATTAFVKEQVTAELQQYSAELQQQYDAVLVDMQYLKASMARMSRLPAMAVV